MSPFQAGRLRGSEDQAVVTTDEDGRLVPAEIGLALEVEMWPQHVHDVPSQWRDEIAGSDGGGVDHQVAMGTEMTLHREKHVQEFREVGLIVAVQGRVRREWVLRMVNRVM